MEIRENKEQRAIICYRAPRPFNIGDVVYFIESDDFQVFRSPCKVCGGIKKITVNNVTFGCPCCNDEKETIKVNAYVVRRYRLYSITDQVSNDEWKASTFHRLEFSFYRKVGHGKGYWNNGHSTKKLVSSELNNYFNLPFDENFKEYNATRCFYDDYKLAVSVAEGLTKMQLEKLKVYNEEHGTEYVANFSAENDKKSN